MTLSARDNGLTLIKFRRATRADVASIVSLTDAAYRGDGLGGWTTEAHLVGVRRIDAEGVEEVLEALERMIIVVEIDGDLAGCVELTRHGNRAVLGMLAVRPELQDRGIGGATIREAERICRDELGTTESRLQVLHMRSDIIAWYDRLGYKPNGERTPFPYGNERVGVPKRDDLEFIVLTKVLE
jgi:ribosomal protein S18 acetylase RimI-like enzyme